MHYLSLSVDQRALTIIVTKHPIISGGSQYLTHILVWCSGYHSNTQCSPDALVAATSCTPAPMGGREWCRCDMHTYKRTCICTCIYTFICTYWCPHPATNQGAFPRGRSPAWRDGKRLSDRIWCQHATHGAVDDQQ